MKNSKQLFSALFLFFMLLGTKNGYLALWHGEDPDPVRIFPVQIQTLPPADQLLLRRGIRVASRLELLTLLEDYL